MAKKTYKLNPDTLVYEVIETPFRLRVYRFLRKVLIGFILASLINLAFSYFFYTPKMYRISQESRNMELKYNVLQDKISAASRKLAEIKHRDTYVYRLLFGADSLDIPEVYAPYPDSKYTHLGDGVYSGLMADTWYMLDDFTRRLYWQSVSLDELQTFSLDKERMALSIPAIWPLDRTKVRNIGAFGGRNHPILGKFHQHTGVDLAAPQGTPVYATGNGIVVQDPGRGTGYGIQIIINHGYGYRTRYAHLSKVAVHPGQAVKRGEIIGEVGNTGRSTSPHLHYEVIYMSTPVDPMNYFRKDMSAEEFEKIIDAAKATTFEEPD